MSLSFISICRSLNYSLDSENKNQSFPTKHSTASGSVRKFHFLENSYRLRFNRLLQSSRKGTAAFDPFCSCFRVDGQRTRLSCWKPIAVIIFISGFCSISLCCHCRFPSNQVHKRNADFSDPFIRKQFIAPIRLDSSCPTIRKKRFWRSFKGIKR